MELATKSWPKGCQRTHPQTSSVRCGRSDSGGPLPGTPRLESSSWNLNLLQGSPRRDPQSPSVQSGRPCSKGPQIWTPRVNSFFAELETVNVMIAVCFLWFVCFPRLRRIQKMYEDCRITNSRKLHGNPGKVQIPAPCRVHGGGSFYKRKSDVQISNFRMANAKVLKNRNNLW